MLTINIAIILPFLAAMFIIIFLRNFRQFHIGWLVLLIPGLLFFLIFQHIPAIANGQTFTNQFNWIPSYNINFLTYLDGLNMIFGLLITGIGTLVVLYSIYYLSTDQSLISFYIYLLLFMGSMLGVVFSDHLMMLYVFWELTSISSFLLIAYWYQRKGSRYGARKALMITVLGGFAMLAGFLMLYVVTGTFSIREIIDSSAMIKSHPLLLPIISLILLGAFTKSAQFPFHTWLPDAMEAPTPISAYLHSATMVKAGIYIIARFTPVFGGVEFWFWAVTSVGLFTLFWASLTAIRQTDLKALLAYSTVSQLGFIITLFGIGSLSFHPNIHVDTNTILYTQAIFAALFHLVNHSTFKGALFMIVGIIDYQIGTRDLRRLGGLIAFMPITFTIALIGSFSMAGLPPFNGFLSKEMFFTAMLSLKEFNIFSVESVATLFPVIAWIASIFTFVYSMMIVFQTFFGTYKEHPTANPKEPPFGMLLPPITLGLLVILIFFFPNMLSDYILKPAVYSVFATANLEPFGTITLWHGFSKELMMTIGVVLAGVTIFLLRSYFKKIYILFPQMLSFDTIYNRSLEFGDWFAKEITNRYMTGYLRHYMAYIFLVFMVLLGGSLYFLDAFSFTTQNDQSVGPFSWILAGTIAIAGMSIIFAQSRLTAIVFNGYIGFAIAMFFVIFKAPDLALTQLVVETVTTALFLLCYYFLPEWEKVPRRINWVNIIISISVGTIFTLIALSVNSGRLFDSISTFYEHADELAGGNNIVNTILGDFRAFDTMLEVIVLFIAGIGVYTMIKFKQTKGASKIED
ncbi:Na+/H+ antiporter subunit A [Pseudogracilibacillus sp. SO30301A]|uniref:Na+/H+ antiporter subunit A n=1 Tax=Pseudogracilibacillus sp. SO30301A TaxID=3098291 RepID=UPI00300E175A